jgi:hypothetical protein
MQLGIEGAMSVQGRTSHRTRGLMWVVLLVTGLDTMSAAQTGLCVTSNDRWING